MYTVLHDNKLHANLPFSKDEMIKASNPSGIASLINYVELDAILPNCSSAPIVVVLYRSTAGAQPLKYIASPTLERTSR